ncbi:LysR family transcriptional regulator [Photobacterium sanctipauli]|uniref:LysR family transcriptional regulator n=2 Tax=Photobacterium sanctipauli TaxID=1342794 RepID=A0A2T3NBM4_9GAMM|nr:LysR family transcriptional regulator [Photobacterium sanctipauli]
MKTMNLNLLATFYTVVMNNSFSVAADKLCLSKSVISKHVKQLEHELRCSLIQRTTRQINLTEEGQFLYERCAEIFDSVDKCYDFIDERKDIVRGKLRVKMPAVLEFDDFITDTFARLLSTYPELELDLIFDNQIGDLIHEQVDLVLKIGALEDSSYKCKKIKNIGTYVVASPAYLDKHGSPEKPLDLIGHKCMNYTHCLTKDKWMFIDDGKEIKIEISPFLQLESESLLTRYALKGMGITTTLDFITESYIQSGELVSMLNDFTWKTELYAVYPNNAVIPLKTRKLIDLLAST